MCAISMIGISNGDLVHAMSVKSNSVSLYRFGNFHTNAKGCSFTYTKECFGIFLFFIFNNLHPYRSYMRHKCTNILVPWSNAIVNGCLNNQESAPFFLQNVTPSQNEGMFLWQTKWFFKWPKFEKKFKKNL